MSASRRTRTRLRKTLVDERPAWLVRVQATLFHHGVSGVPDKLLSAKGREFLDGLELPPAARERIEVALALIEALDRQLQPLESELRRLARRRPITSPARGPSTQISPGARGTTALHNHSPPAT